MTLPVGFEAQMATTQVKRDSEIHLVCLEATDRRRRLWIRGSVFFSQGLLFPPRIHPLKACLLQEDCKEGVLSH